MSCVSNRSGFVILSSVLIMGAVALSIASSVLLLGIGSSRTSLVQQQGYLSQSLADSCAEIALAKLIVDPDYAGETIDPIGGGICTIDVNQSCTDCIIQATGEVGPVVRKTKITVAVGTGGGGSGGLLLGKGLFPISPATLSYTAAGSTGTVTVKDNATTPNQPATENLVIAAATKPVIRTNDNRVNVGDSVTLSGTAFTASSVLNTATCNCGGVSLVYCAELSFNGTLAPPHPDLGTTGNFSGFPFTIPPAPYGRRNLTGTDKGVIGVPSCTSQKTSEIQVFFVEPKITQVSFNCASNPKTINISGTGFDTTGASPTATILWENADTLTTASIGSNGSFSSTTFNLPAIGTQKIKARDKNYKYSTNSLPNPCP